MLSITVKRSGKKRRVIFPMLTKQVLSCMTEKTQEQMFGHVVQPRTNTSIHNKVRIS